MACKYPACAIIAMKGKDGFGLYLRLFFLCGKMTKRGISYNKKNNIPYNIFFESKELKGYFCSVMRSKELKAARDRKIVEKFHELYDLKRMRMDDVLILTR